MAWRTECCMGCHGWPITAVTLCPETTFRHMPMASAESLIESEGGIGKVPVGRIFGSPQIDTGPRRPPSARAETLKNKHVTMGPNSHHKSHLVPEVRILHPRISHRLDLASDDLVGSSRVDQHEGHLFGGPGISVYRRSHFNYEHKHL